MADFYTGNLRASRLARGSLCRIIFRMDRPTAIEQIRAACQQIASGVTSIHPLLPALGDEPTKAEIIKALFELTKSVEVVKKQVMRLEKRDDSALT
jgi:hypothetical protein